MHEMALCESMIDIVAGEAKKQAFSTVRIIVVEIGALGHVEPDALRFAFDAVSRGTLADGAELRIEIVPGSAWCMECGKSVAISARYDPCPSCGGHQLQLTAGDDLKLKELEVA